MQDATGGSDTAANPPPVADASRPDPSLMRETLSIVIPAVVVVLAAFWVAFQFVEPAPPKKVVMVTGSEGGAYHAFGKRYASILKRSGIELELRTSKGSVENYGLITKADAGVQLALLQGGIADRKQPEGVVSLGRVFLEPVWIFHRLEGRVDRLVDLVGKRVAIGAEGSGTRRLCERLLAASGMTFDAQLMLPISGQAAADALVKGEVDAVVLVFAPEAPVIQGLLRNPAIKLLNLRQAEAYTRLLPFLTRVELPAGVVDIARNLPADDVALLAAQSAVVAREDLHPAIVALMVDALTELHAEGGLFQKIGEFPKTADPEFAFSEDAARIYKSGQPFLRRYLPFWLAVFIERMMVLALPIATILIPVVKFVPVIYQWRIRRRILYWYGVLKGLEARIKADRGGNQSAAHRAEIDRIDEAVGHIPVPVRYSEQLYDLRGAVDFVRARLYARA